MHAAELVLGIGWAAFWTYWLVTTLTSKRAAWPNAAKPFDDDQLRALVYLIALINLYNATTASPISPQVTTHPVSGDNGVKNPMVVPKSCPTQSACTAGRVRSK